VPVTLVHVAAGNAYGGIEQMLVTLAKTAHPAVTQQFVVSFAGRLERELRDAGAVVHRLPSPRASRPLMIWRARRAFRSVQEQVTPDVTIFHSAWPHAMFAASARAGGARVGFWQHQPITRPAWPDRWARQVQPDFTIFNSAYTQARPAFPAVRGRVIHCAVGAQPAIDVDARQQARKKLGAADDDVVVFMAARLERWKGHDVLLSAAALVPDSARLQVWIAGGAQQPGEKTYADELAALAASAPLRHRVKLLGERDDVPDLMRLADIYCQPNLKAEPFGIAIAEAMRGGLPCVISAAGGAAELADERSAIATAPGDRQAVVEALTMLAEDASLRATMGAAARARAERLTDPRGRLDELADFVTREE
jgi:glycosyltransferase involved in cell wall biosynthesis